jgi:hypothetical protein
MSRAVLNSPEDFLSHEPHKSIINILMIAPSFDESFKHGLSIDYLKCLIIKDYNSKSEKLSRFREFLLKNAADKVTLDQDIKPGLYRTKTGKKSTTIHHLFYGYLKKLEDEGLIDKKHDVCSLSEEYKILTLKTWHRKIIDNSKINNIFALRDFVFYFANNYFDVKQSYLSHEDVDKMSEICDELSKKILDIDNIFKHAGVRKAVHFYKRFLEKEQFKNKALKELCYIYLIGDLTAGLGNIDYNFAIEKEKIAAGPLGFLDNQMSFINLIKMATEQYIKTKYKMTDEDYNDLLNKYNNSYYRLHDFLINNIHDFAVAHMEYSLISERPHLFGVEIKPPFVDFQSVHNLMDYKKLKNKTRKNTAKINEDEHLKAFFNELERQDKIVEKATSVIQINLPKTSIKKKKSSFFKDNNFLDGFEDDLKELGMNIGEAYEKLDDTATLFNKY